MDPLAAFPAEVIRLDSILRGIMSIQAKRGEEEGKSGWRVSEVEETRPSLYTSPYSYVG